MTTEPVEWEPIEPDQLQIGHFIKIDHRWFDHPFVRRSFQLSSERELATIREVKLTRVFVDRKQSAVAGGLQPTAQQEEAAPPPEAPPANPEADAAPVDDAAKARAEAAAAVQAESEAAAAGQAEAARIRAQRVSLDAASARDRVTLERARALLPALDSGDATGAAMVDEFIDYLVAILNNSTTPLTLMAAAAPRRSSMRLVLQMADAVSLVALVGKRMGLKKEQLRTLTQAAATHSVGLARMPPQLVDEEPEGDLFNGATFRNYPLLGASILNKCGGFQAEVLRIVAQHRERPDGSGFPRGLQGDAIKPLALILGAVREFQIRCNNDTSPVLALAYLHRHCREIYGAEIIGHLAATMLVYPVGTYVQLSDGRVARIVSINEAARTAPTVHVYEDRSALRDWTTLDLSQSQGISIVRALDTSYLPPRLFAAPRAAVGSAPPKKSEAEPPPQPDPQAEPQVEATEPAQASGAK
jgi:HD-GYP domain-containing protein (c-di-GMP phosphodiesterase class II)